MPSPESRLRRFGYFVLAVTLLGAVCVVAVAVIRGVVELNRLGAFVTVEQSSLRSYRSSTFEYASLLRTSRTLVDGPAISGRTTLLLVVPRIDSGSRERSHCDRWMETVTAIDSRATVVIVLTQRTPITARSVADLLEGEAHALSVLQVWDIRGFRAQTGIRATPAALILSARGEIIAASLGFANPQIMARLADRIVDKDDPPVLFQVTRDAAPIH